MSNKVISIRGQGTAGESDDVAIEKASTGSSISTGIKAKGIKIGVCAFLACVAIVAIALGAVFPSMVKKQIQDGIYKAIRYDPEKLDADKLAKFYNGTMKQDFYIYEVTNLKAALAGTEKLNFAEVGPIKLIKYNQKYNVSWDLDNGQVSFKNLATFDVDPESYHLLSRTVTAVNIHYFGAAAQTMQGFLQNGNPTTPLTVDFPGGFLNEQVLTGLLIGTIGYGTGTGPKDAGVLKGFVTPGSALSSQIRGLGLGFYLGYALKYIATKEVQNSFPAGTLLAPALQHWASGTAFLSANFTSGGVQMLAADSEQYFLGFELPFPLSSPNATTTVVSALFDPTNPNSFLSSTGLLTWLTLASNAATAQQYVTDNHAPPPASMTQAISLIKQKLGSTTGLVGTDFDIILLWFSSLLTAEPLPSVRVSVGSAYLLAVTSAISVQLAANAAAPGATPFKQAFGSISAFFPKTWTDIAALQFGSGALLGVATGSPNFLTNGIGISFSDLFPTYIGPTSPWNFDDLASGTTLGQAEPMELTAGAKYAATWVAPTSPLTTLHVAPMGNPSLLYVNTTTSTMKVLNIAQSTALLNTITASVPNYLQLVSGLTTLATTYATTLKSSLAARVAAAMAADSSLTQAQATGMSLPSAHNDAATAVAGTLAYFQGYQNVSAAQCTDEVIPRATAKLILAAGVDANNWYLVFTYLYSYLANELTGSLSQLDPEGIAPQNAGMFSKRTVWDHLFGYNARFPGQAVPGVAGVYHFSKPMAELINDDYKKKLGRDTVQQTGHADINTVGQYAKYEGITSYTNNCDLVDPGRRYICADPASAAVNDYVIWGEAETVTGNGDGSNTPPFLESDDDRVPIVPLYVTEAKRSLQLEYTEDVVVKDIPMRRYEVPYMALANLSESNPSKNNHKWKQGSNAVTPNAFFAASRLNKGAPLLLSKPYWDFSDAGFTGGVTCTNPVTLAPGQDCRSLYVKENHNTYLDFEPISGLAMNGHKRLQATVRIQAFEFYTGSAPCPSGGTTCAPTACTATTPAPGSYAPYFGSPLQSKMTNGVNFHYNGLFQSSTGTFTPTLFLPYYWADLHDTINDADTADFLDAKKKIEDGRKMGDAIQIAGVVGGSVGFVAAAGAIIYLAMH